MPQLLSEAIGADHDEFDVLYENIKNATDDAAKVRWRNQLTWTVARHAISEELTWYPAMEKHLGEEGTRLAKTDKEQHQGVGSSYIPMLCWAKLTRWE
jgi:hemerythrin superfamily protein